MFSAKEIHHGDAETRSVRHIPSRTSVASVVYFFRSFRNGIPAGAEPPAGPPRWSRSVRSSPGLRRLQRGVGVVPLERRAGSPKNQGRSPHLLGNQVTVPGFSHFPAQKNGGCPGFSHV